MSEVADATHSVGMVASALLLTERQVQSLAKQGIIPKAANGRYDMVAAVQAYIRYLRERNLGRGNPDEHSAGQQLVQQNVRRASEQADALAMQNAAARGEMVPVGQVTSAIVGMIEVTKAKLKRVGAKVAQGDPVLRARVNRAIEDALIDLSATGADEVLVRLQQ
jgi:phage terminase Nu1 subunit (DNA packaging protein)